MNLTTKPVLDFSLTETIDVLNKGFSDYTVKLEFSLPMLMRMVARDGMNVADSRVVLRDGKGVGVAWIARRGWKSRVAGMAIVPEARGMGVGTWFMEQLIQEAQERGDRQMELEVISSNVPAIKLYQHSGFQKHRRLVSMALFEVKKIKTRKLEEIDIHEAAQWVVAYGLKDLPWQVSGETLVMTTPPSKAFRLGDACVVITDPERPQVAIQSVVVHPDGRGQGQATMLLNTVLSTFRGKTWHVPALCPEELAGLFKKTGFEEEELAQFHMVRYIEGT